MGIVGQLMLVRRDLRVECHTQGCRGLTAQFGQTVVSALWRSDNCPNRANAFYVGYDYTCGAPNETKPGYCGRGVSRWGMRCCCHGGGPCGHRGGAPSEQDDPYVPAPREPMTSYEPTDHQLNTMVDIVQKIVTDGWEATVAGQLAAVLNDDFWKSVPRWSRRRPDCRRLAELANVMELAKKSAHDAVGAMVNEGLGWFGRPTLERRIGEEFAERIPLPGDKEIAAVIHALRITGIWVCVPNGIRYVVTQCPCFDSLAKGKTEEELKKVLKEKLDVLEAQYRPTWLPS